jgi:uncharacterized protein (DUF2062 family)
MISHVKLTRYRWYRRFIKLQASPHAIAGGMALGLFIGMSPFFGLHVITAVALAALFKWSKITALIGVQITNALTAPVIYPVNYWIGSKLAGSSGRALWPADFSFGEITDLLRQSTHIITDLMIGGVVLGLPLAIGGYAVTLRLVIAYRRRRQALQASDDLPI